MTQTSSKTIFMVKLASLEKDKKAEILKTLGVSRQAYDYWMKGGLPSKERVNTLVSLFGFQYNEFFVDVEIDELLD